MDKIASSRVRLWRRFRLLCVFAGCFLRSSRVGAGSASRETMPTLYTRERVTATRTALNITGRVDGEAGSATSGLCHLAAHVLCVTVVVVCCRPGAELEQVLLHGRNTRGLRVSVCERGCVCLCVM